MKKALLFLSPVVFFLAVSCGGNKPSGMIVGKWQATKIEAGEEAKKAEEEMKKSMADLNSMMDSMGVNSDSIKKSAEKEQAQKMDEMAKGMSMEFKSDGTVAATMDGKTSNGKYTLSEDGKTLTIDDGSQAPPFKVVSLSDKEMVLDMAGLMTVHMDKQ